MFRSASFPRCHSFGVPSLEDHSGQPDRDLLLRIRQRLLEKLPSASPSEEVTPRKIYISRSKAMRRKLSAANEKIVNTILQQAGYTTVHFEDYSWPQQIQLMIGAESIVGLHGAGLANILFSRATSLIEFHYPMEVRPYFAIIARELDMEYAYLIGDLDGVSQRSDNIVIDPQQLQRVLDQHPASRSVL